ncbi:MAG: alpha/beta hydrolase [Deltaproteobacteria bacterium]
MKDKAEGKGRPAKRGSRLWKLTKWLLGLLIVGAVVFFYGVVPWFLAGIASTRRFHYRDPLDGKTPASYGMKYHDIEFKSSDGIDLKGWYAPAEGQAKGTIIYVHGYNRSRVEMLPDSVFGHGLGYNALLFDLRHQGASGGEVSTIGYQERLDVEAAAKYALERENAARPVIAWGVSMGAAASLEAAADSPDIAAVISDSTFLNYQDMVYHHYYLFRSIARSRGAWWFPPLPAFPIVNEVIFLATRRGNFDADDFDLEKAVTKIGARPILFVGVEGDPRMPPEIARRLYGDAESELKDIVIVPGTRHGEGFTSGNRQYEEAVTEFLAGIQEKISRSATPGGPAKAAPKPKANPARP